MKATLKGNNFEIEEISEMIQVLTLNNITQWKWQIKALKEGPQSLHLSITAIFKINGEEERKTFRTYDRKIDVIVKNKIKFFFFTNWYWITTFISAITVIYTTILTINNKTKAYKKTKKKIKRRKK